MFSFTRWWKSRDRVARTSKRRGQLRRRPALEALEDRFVPSLADPAVTIEDLDPVIAGEDIAYHVRLTNFASADAINVALLNTIPANTTFVSFHQFSGPAFTINRPAVGGSGEVTATIALFDFTADFTLVVRTAPGLANNTVIANTATVTTDSAERSTTNNTFTATTRIAPLSFLAVGAKEGDPPRVAAFNRTGGLVANFLAYPRSYKGGVRVAVGDVNGDGVADIITAGGLVGGQPIQVVDGTQLDRLGPGRVPPSALLRSFFIRPASFAGGFFLAAGDFNADAHDDIVIGAGAGVPHVWVVDGASGARLASFRAYADSFKSGVTVAAGDVNGDGRADVIVAPLGGARASIGSQTSAQRVLVADGTKLPVRGARIREASLLGSFFPFQPDFTGGFFVAAGDVNDDLRDDVIVAQSWGAPPVLKVVDAARLGKVLPSGRIRNSALVTEPQQMFRPSFRGGVHISTMERDPARDGRAEVLIGPPPGHRRIRFYDPIRDSLDAVYELVVGLPFDAASIAGKY